MIDKIISYSIQNKLIIGLFTLALIAAGLWSMKKVPLDAVPDITNNQVQVITTAPNLGTTDIEQFVTYPVELAMSNLPGVNEIRSVSRFGLSVVTVVFDDDKGTYLPRQVVSEKLGEVAEQIPEGFGTPFMGPISTGLGEIYQYTLEVDPKFESKYSPTDLRSIQDWIVRRQMAMVPGVVEINSMGGNQKQYEVAIDPNRLLANQLSLAQVFDALKDNNENTGGAYIEKDHKANFIRGEGILRTKSDIENIVVSVQNNTPILVKDIAEVRFGSAVRYGAFTKNGKEAVGGIIMMIKDGNSNDVITDVKERIAQIQKSLPEGVSIEPLLDRSKLIEKTTSTVSGNLIEGGLIVIFILVILLGNWRGGLIVASTIPLSLLFAFIMMNIFGVWANLMSLGAIDFGIIVDGAVIIVESIVFYLSRQLKKPSSDEMNDLTQKSSSKMMNSAFFGQFIILIVFIPILALEGVEGKMFRPMAQTFAFALIGAMILCLTYVPMISSIFLKKSKSDKPGFGDKIVKGIENFFEPILAAALRRGKIVLIGSIAILISSIVLFSRMGGEFIPQLDEGDLAFHAILKPGSSLSETVATTTRIEKLLKETYPEITTIASRIGVAEVPTDPMPMDIADVFVLLKPQDEWTSAENKDELIEKMKATVHTIPGVNYEFTQPIEMRFNELLTGVREDIAIKLFGEDLDILATKAEEIGKIIAGTDGVADMKVEATAGLPQITVNYKSDMLARYGLSVVQLNQLVSSAFAGGTAGIIFEGEKRFDLVVRLNQKNRTNINDIRELYITLSNGSQIPLREVADINYEGGPMQISRENTARRTYVGINVRGRDIKSLVEEIQEKLDQNLDLPAGYYIRYGGAFENLERASKRLQVVIPIALGLIFLLIFFALKSMKQSVMIYMAIPFAAIGGIYSLWLRDMPFSISAGVGFIVLFGVAVLNGLVLISSLNELKEEGITNIKDRILQGTRRRIRPILLTASTDVLGFLPMAISTSAGAEVQRPLATVVIGGLLTSTLLTLIVLPILYQWLENRSEKRLSKKVIPAVATVALLFFFSGNVNAQEAISKEITLSKAIELAKNNYPSIEAARLEIERQKQLKKTSLDLGETVISWGEDSKGGSETSTRTIGFEQSNIDIFSTNAKNKYQETQIELANIHKSLTIMNVESAVRKSWNQAVIKKKRLLLANELDSIYTGFERAAKLRYEAEATSKLEWLMATNQAKQIRIAMQESEAQYQNSITELNFWLKADYKFDVPSSVKDSKELNLNNSNLKNHPLMDLANKNTKAQQALVKVEQRALLPKLNLQYDIQKIGNQTGYYSYQAGISIPLWNRPQKGRIKAAKTNAQIASLQEEEQKMLLLNELKQVNQNYQQYYRSIDYFEKEALPIANEQIKGAQLAYKKGELDYLQFSKNLEEAIAIKQTYLNKLESYLESVNRVQYLTNSY
ncbi:CusA/CzcA family heavy metal efflux RND transporter [Marinifilum fragile]|uniref:CusA/CzcA family heavy metal efflux RND transporter n=1 Tax=Marinifilum fragile TaxID=570161 RepID=UPI002AA6DA2F|nr:CusA/CzcA family heavy metal efflux RND transporter [Marinifilum fragile]